LIEQAAVDLVDDFEVAGQQAAEERQRPFSSAFGSSV
jgi:hypothetical protein